MRMRSGACAGGAFAAEVALHARQGRFGFFQAAVFAAAVGQAPDHQLGQVVAFQALLLRSVEQLRALLVQLPGAPGVADVAQGQYAQLEQQVVVGLLLAGALDRAEGIQPAGLVAVAADLGQGRLAVRRAALLAQARAVQARPTQSASRRWTTIGDPLASEPDNLKNVTHITCQLLAWPWPASLPSCIPAQQGRIQPGQRPAMSCLKRESPHTEWWPGGAAAPMPDAGTRQGWAFVGTIRPELSARRQNAQTG
jgi:hypothetical protein